MRCSSYGCPVYVIAAVSYTHLDVYKRQALDTAFIQRTTQALSGGNAKSALDGLQSDLEKLYK